MKKHRLLPLALSAAASVLAPPSMAAPVTDAACDRACLQAYGDRFLASVVAHDPAGLPLTQDYAATENSVAAALPMMTLWQTVTAVKTRFMVIDPRSGQLFLAAGIAEGGHDSLLFGRLKVDEGKFSEIEIYVSRSRGESGFQFGPREWASPPRAWTDPVAASRIPSRADLLRAGRSIFDSRIEGPAPAPGCILMENGKIVAEDPEILKRIAPPGSDAPPAVVGSDGLVSIPCGSPPDRPTDPDARTTIVDEMQGIVVSFGTVYGVTGPYLITSPTTSAYVPHALYKPYGEMLARQRASGEYRLPALRQMEGSQTVAQMQRYYDGKLQAMEMFQKSAAPGARSPWGAGGK
jgi:hypothetical protein